MSRIDQALEQATNRRSNDAAIGDVTIGYQNAEVSPVHDIASDFWSTGPLYPLQAVEKVVTLDPAADQMIEEYKKLKIKLLNRMKSQSYNSVMVTSAQECEGKTVTSLNLALTMAEEFDHTVLLVDSDLRDMACTQRFGMVGKPGLSDCLSGDANISEALVKTGYGKLMFLPAGTRVDNPVELLSSKRMKGLVDEMQQRYSDRFLLFDTPSARDFAETRHLAHIVDGVLFVVKEESTSLEEIAASLDSLHAKEIFGIVYNGHR